MEKLLRSKLFKSLTRKSEKIVGRDFLSHAYTVGVLTKFHPQILDKKKKKSRTFNPVKICPRPIDPAHTYSYRRDRIGILPGVVRTR